MVDGVLFTGPTTYRTKRDAETFLAATRVSLERGSWHDPAKGKVELRDYAAQWLAHKPSLRPRTKEQYEINLRLHILPLLGGVELSKFTPTTVRSWHARLLSSGQLGPSTVAKCYRLLHAIFATAVEDELLERNPCVLRGAASHSAPERPTATIQEVYELARAVDPSLQAMVLLATFTGLRLGELRALRRNRIDLVRRTLKVVEQLQELSSGAIVVGPPKTAAGRRTVVIPDAIIPELEAHLAQFSAPGPDGLVFCGSGHQPLSRKTFYRNWAKAVRDVGLVGFRFHDLRHTGNTLAAATGASTKELMSRMGHASPRAALIYQHATLDRDAQIASGLSELIVRSASDAEPDDIDNPPGS